MSPLAFPVFVSVFVSVFLAAFVSVYVFVFVLLTQMVENIDAGCHHWLSLASALSGLLESFSSSSGREERASSGYVTHLVVNGWLRPQASHYSYLPYASSPTPTYPLPKSSSELSSSPETVIPISVWLILVLSTSSPPELAPPTEYRIFGRVNRDKSRRRAGGR